MHLDDEPKPEGWRPEWREPKLRKQPRARAREQSVADPLPGPEMLREEICVELRAIVRDPESSAVARVQAAKALLEATEPNPREVMLRLLRGDKAALVAWCRETIEAIEGEREKGA